MALSCTYTLQREDSSRITIQATGATSWRRADVKYRKNEAFVDVVETVNLMMSREGESLAVGNDSTPTPRRLRIASRCGRPNSHESLSQWHTRVQVWLE
jgi:hypothetical protein